MKKLIFATFVLIIASSSIASAKCVVVIAGKTYVLQSTCVELKILKVETTTCIDAIDRTSSSRPVKILRYSDTRVEYEYADKKRAVLGSDEGQKRLEALIAAKDIKGLQSFKDPGGTISEKTIASQIKTWGSEIVVEQIQKELSNDSRSKN